MKNRKDKSSYILTRETFGMTICLFSALVFLMLLTRGTVFAGIGVAVCTFLYGMFGYGSYLLLFLLAYLGEWMVFEKKIKLSLKTWLVSAAFLLSAFVLFHAVSTRSFALDNYGDYLAACYNNAALGFSGYTFGGLVSGLIVYPVAKGTTFVGVYVIFSLLILLCGYFAVMIGRSYYLNRSADRIVNQSQKSKKGKAAKEEEASATETDAENDNLYSVGENYEIVENRASSPYGPRASQNTSPYAGSLQNHSPYASGSPYDTNPYGNNAYGNQMGSTIDANASQPTSPYAKPVSQPTSPYGNNGTNRGANQVTTNAVSTQTTQEQNANAQGEKDNDKFSSKNLGRKILFENGEFAAESYRRNMIYNEDSYFNHPVRGEDNYLKSFGIEKKDSVVADNASYVQSYQDTLQGQTMPTGGGYSYEKPVETLDNYTVRPAENPTSQPFGGNPYQTNSQPYSSNSQPNQTEGWQNSQNNQQNNTPYNTGAQTYPTNSPYYENTGSPYQNTGSPYENKQADQADLGEQNTYGQTSPYELNPYKKTQTSPYQNTDSTPKVGTNLGDELYPNTRRMLNFDEPDKSAQEEQKLESNGRSGGENLNRLNGETAGRSDNGADQNKEGTATNDRGREGRSSLFNLFSADNSNLGENRVEPDLSRLSRPDRSEPLDRRNNPDRSAPLDRTNQRDRTNPRERSNANIFDDDSDDALFDDNQTLENNNDGRSPLFRRGENESSFDDFDSSLCNDATGDLSANRGCDGLELDNSNRDSSPRENSGRESLGRQSEGLGRQSDNLGRQSDNLGRQSESLGRQNESLGRQNDNLGRQNNNEGSSSVFGQDDFLSGKNRLPEEGLLPVPGMAPKPEPAPAPAPEPEKPKHVWKEYVRPSLDLLKDYPETGNINTNEIEHSKQVIVETLNRFRIECSISNVVVGPAITRYDVTIADSADIKNSLKYREAISMALKKDNVTVYLNYSKGALSFEVPNDHRTTVGLKALLASSTFINSKPNSLTFGFGKNVEGEVVCPDITKMPHLLVAGSTGSGKSVCLNALICSLLYKYGPEDLRFILVDPKQVEFISYDKLPHLMINEIIYDVDKAIKALNWAIAEMERRYALFKDKTMHGIATKDLDDYNAHLEEGEEKLAKIVIILDEFGDLMLQAKRDIESRIVKLVQKARACGIHLILATQRPSVDCITGLIKANLPTKIGFRVGSYTDSSTIFDRGGAEKLLGYGDAYFKLPTSPDLLRVQGCFISAEEVLKVTNFVRENNETYFDQSVSDFINTVEEDDDVSSENTASDKDDSKIDDTFIKALKYCVDSNQASVSMIQRRFPVGYIKACKIIDWMTNMNYITPSEGSKPRKVLLTKDDFINKYGEIDD